MTTKLKRDARAFVQRARMSGTSKLWVLVEGKVHDRAFYDRLLSFNAEAHYQDHDVRVAEELSLEGKEGSGKTHVLALYALYEREGLLRAASRTAVHNFLFVVDRDLDVIAERLRGGGGPKPHLITTLTRDIESDILLHGDVVRAVSSTYSIGLARSRAIVASARQAAADLANLWREWIKLGVCEVTCELKSGLPHGKHSLVNKPSVGPVDGLALTAWRSHHSTRAADLVCEERYSSVERWVDEQYLEGDQWRLVKGKWLAWYIARHVQQRCGDMPMQSGVPDDVLSKTCLETLDFTAEWTNAYLGSINTLSFHNA